jgi:hypothetical protein
MKTEKLSSSCVVSRFVMAFILTSFLVLPKAHAVIGDTFTIDQLKYTVLTEGSGTRAGTVSVQAESKEISGDIVIPASVANGGINYSVTLILDQAFRECLSLTGITIPKCVTAIGNLAFIRCSELTNIIIPDSVTEIGLLTFYGCDKLPPILFSTGKKILVRYSKNNTAEEYSIPDTVTYIAGGAFMECSNLTSIEIPDSVTEIGRLVFHKCDKLPPILFSKGKKILARYSPSNKDSSYSIPDTVTYIAGAAFYECDSLTNIAIPDSVTEIGEGAFQGCSKLTSIAIPEGVTAIGLGAFYRCGKLTAVYFKGNAPKLLKGSAFYDPSVIYYKPDTKGWKNPWDDRPAKEWSDTPNSVGAFFTIDQLKYTVLTEDKTSQTGTVSVKAVSTEISGDIEIPASVANGEINYSVTLIPDEAFISCSSLTSVTVGNGVTSIGNSAFQGCSSLTSIAIPNSVTSIGAVAFIECSSLTSIIIPDNVSKIDDGAFAECNGLTSLTIGNSVNSIGKYAFSGCSSLTSITIPDSVTSIGYGAFGLCGKLTAVYFKGNAPKLPEGDAFFFPSVIHYKPGTTGWTNPRDGRPTWSGTLTTEWVE